MNLLNKINCSKWRGEYLVIAFAIIQCHWQYQKTTLLRTCYVWEKKVNIDFHHDYYSPSPFSHSLVIVSLARVVVCCLCFLYPSHPLICWLAGWLMLIPPPRAASVAGNIENNQKGASIPFTNPSSPLLLRAKDYHEANVETMDTSVAEAAAAHDKGFRGIGISFSLCVGRVQNGIDLHTIHQITIE